MGSSLQRLLDRAHGPTGQSCEVVLGDQKTGPFAELGKMLTSMNGFFAFNCGVQVFRAGGQGVGPELQSWNERDTWKWAYESTIPDRLFCFGQDLLGTQFCIQGDDKVVTFDPESTEITHLGDSLEDWAKWFFDDPEDNACRDFARAWQDSHGPLEPGQRLVPWTMFILGGSFDFENLSAKSAEECMRIRGPIAAQLANLPEGAQVEIKVGSS